MYTILSRIEFVSLFSTLNKRMRKNDLRLPTVYLIKRQIFFKSIDQLHISNSRILFFWISLYKFNEDLDHRGLFQPNQFAVELSIVIIFSR